MKNISICESKIYVYLICPDTFFFFFFMCARVLKETIFQIIYISSEDPLVSLTLWAFSQKFNLILVHTNDVQIVIGNALGPLDRDQPI